jgi:lyso-ornithine lipid O-acyltransferase
VTWGDATAYDMSADRKQIARDAEQAVRRMTAAALRAGPPSRPSATPASTLPEPLPEAA